MPHLIQQAFNANIRHQPKKQTHHAKSVMAQLVHSLTWLLWVRCISRKLGNLNQLTNIKKEKKGAVYVMKMLSSVWQRKGGGGPVCCKSDLERYKRIWRTNVL
ncbi:hypothetical protein E2C01_002700 [Portunus trituberculatus]|uniref:Uncharacterized protein n=1 Tax=Portunus trituberculatus TaxID=210409 RepID=A0A5B7CMV6_PORTR|nr:hypothetical protein [Portunus trituberculatus]